MIIYKATNKKNGKIYIGQTVRPLKVRIQEHARHSDSVFDKAIQKHGIENFEFEVIDTANSIEELNQKEIYWIEHYNSYKGDGYNSCIGGENTIGFRHTEESRGKMSVAKKKMYVGAGNPFYNKNHSEESRRKMSEKRKGRVLTEEWKKHISENNNNKRRVRNIETGEVFETIKEAADKYNIIPTHITRVCRGRRKSTGGYHWEYIS